MLRTLLLLSLGIGLAVVVGCGGDGAGPVPPVGGNTIYVDAAAPAGGDGSQTSPFNDLQAAANVAESGDTIKVAAGTYDPAGDDRVSVPEPVTIEGAGRDTTLLQSLLLVEANDPDATVTVTGVDCQGVDFAVETTTPSPVLVRNCRLDRVDERGGNRTHSLTVEDTQIRGGVVFAQGDGDSRDVFRRCTVGGTVSLRMGDGARVTFTGCTLPGGVGDAGGTGLTSLVKCDLAGAVVACSGGAALSGGYRIVVEDCRNLTGVDCSANGGLRLADSTIAGCVSLSCGGTTDVIGNTITGAGSGGGLLTSAGPGVITGNTISGFELGLRDSSGATLVADNTIENCTQGALARGLGEWRNNTVRNCTDYGVFISAVVTDLAFHHNTVRHNGGDGVIVKGRVDLGGGAAGSPGQNIIRGNGGYDLRVQTLAVDQAATFARTNFWDHATAAEIGTADIYDGADDGSLSLVSLLPLGSL